MLRLVLDVNVWVANVLASARGRDGTSCQLLVESAILGHCRLGPLISRISLPMLDTLQAVLERDFALSPNLAEAARNVAEAAGEAPFPPLAVVGGGILPMRDREDQGVLETALAARADVMVTGNMRDFTPGPRSGIDADILRLRGGRADVLLMKHARVPNGMVIATPLAAKAWLIDGHVPPPGVLNRFLPGRDLPVDSPET